MTQTDLARLVWNETYVDKRGYEVVKGKDRISSYINGKQQPSPLVYNKILEVLKLTPEDLPLRRRPAEWAAVRRTVLREQDRLTDMEGAPSEVGWADGSLGGARAMSPAQSEEFLEFLRTRAPIRQRALELMRMAADEPESLRAKQDEADELSMRLLTGENGLARLKINVVVSPETALQVMRLIQDDQKARKASSGK